MKEKKDWNETIYTERIRISKKDKAYINKIKKKKSLAGMLSEIIQEHDKRRVLERSNQKTSSKALHTEKNS
jgi:hypothetical protein